MTKLIGITIGMTILSFGSLFFFVVLQTDLPFLLMDTNLDRHLTVSEFFASVDLGVRSINLEGRECSEVFSKKDALPITYHCSWLP